jgi:hypothetical protein
MARFTQNFTLTDIFNNKKLKDKIPLINYKEKELENGKISRRTNAKTVNRQVFDTATSAARPFYKPIKTTRSGDTMIISGELVGDHDGAVDAVYNAIQSKKSILIWTANNADMIRSALKEAEKNKRNYGINSKLYLRVQSMQQIEGMTKPQIQALMGDIMENIMYGDDFPETQKKFNVKEMLDTQARTSREFTLTYSQRQLRWKYKVGDL